MKAGVRQRVGGQIEYQIRMEGVKDRCEEGGLVKKGSSRHRGWEYLAEGVSGPQ